MSAPIANAADAEAAIAALQLAMDRLQAVLTQETELLRSGHVRDAIALEAKKQAAATDYTASAARVRLAAPLVARALPQLLVPLRQRHAELQKLLHANMTVLATAHAVSEGIIRGVSGELAKRRSPSTYGASGRANTPPPRTGQPLAVSRAI
jgi:hypothetical protein